MPLAMKSSFPTMCTRFVHPPRPSLSGNVGWGVAVATLASAVAASCCCAATDCASPPRPAPPEFTAASLPSGVWVTEGRVTLEWAQPPGDTCGVDGYGEYWSASAGSCPAEVKDLEESPTTTTRLLPDGIWYYTLKSVDHSGQWSTDCARAGPFQIDRTPPGPPYALRSETHGVRRWSRSQVVDVLWDPPQELGSGVVGYAALISRGAPQRPEPNQELGPVLQFQFQTAVDGNDIYANLLSRDAVGLWGESPASLGPLWIDTVPPTAPGGFDSFPHVVSVPSAIQRVTVDWQPSTDATSGIRSYSVLWNSLPEAEPIGGLDSTSPTSTSPTLMNGKHWLHVAAMDHAGNRSETSHVGPFWIAVPPPDAPEIQSGSHGLGVCSSDCTIDVAWTLTNGAIAYSTLWSQTPDAVPDTLVDTVVRAGSSPCLQTGSWYFHLRAFNGAGAWSDATHIGPLLVDREPPPNPAELRSDTHAPDRWSAHSSIQVHWTATGDAMCGPVRYSLAFDRAPFGIPDAQGGTLETTGVSPELADGGPWYAHVRAIDAAGNASVLSTHLGPLWIDSAPPTVALVPLAEDGALVGGSDLEIEFTADDILSGVESVRVELSLDGGASFGEEIGRAVPPDATVAWKVPELDAPTARFRVTARDRAGNESSDQSDTDFSIRRSTGTPDQLPAAYALGPNVPNPFNPSTRLTVDLPQAGEVRVDVVDLRGRGVAVLLDGWQEGGRRQLQWDGRDSEGQPLPSGVYICRIRAGSFHASRKLTILR